MLQSMVLQRVTHDYVAEQHRTWHTVPCTIRQVFISYLFYVCCLVAKLSLTPCNPMEYSPPGSSIHGISQAWILEWIAISFSTGSSQPRDQTCISWVGRQILSRWATQKAHDHDTPSHNSMKECPRGLWSSMKRAVNRWEGSNPRLPTRGAIWSKFLRHEWN